MHHKMKKKLCLDLDSLSLGLFSDRACALVPIPPSETLHYSAVIDHDLYDARCTVLRHREGTVRRVTTYHSAPD